MKRHTKLFCLNDIDYNSIKESIEFERSAERLTDCIAIFNRSSVSNNSFRIISADEIIDSIVIQHGGIDITKNTVDKQAIREGHIGDIQFGNELLVDSLLNF